MYSRRIARTAYAEAGVFCTRFCIIAFLCLVAVIRINAQEVEHGAYPTRTSGEFEAPVRIEIFNDYQCPPCAKMNSELKKVEATYPGKVRVTFRNFPLVTLHTNALAAAKAAEAAGLQGKFLRMIDLLYARVEDWSSEVDPTDTFVSYAKELELDIKRFTTDVTSDLVAERIALDIKRAKFLDVTGTPALFVNGKKLEDSDHGNLLEAVRVAF